MIGVRKSARSLPLGVDARESAVSVVAAVVSDSGFVVREARSLDVDVPPDAGRDRAIAEALRRIVDELQTRERRCILAAPDGEALMRTFRVPPNMGRREAERAAQIEANAIVDWTASERLVALDPIPNRDDGDMLLSVARTSAVTRVVAIARAAGLRAVAVDTSACAWRRAVPGVDAVLNCTGERSVLEIFGNPVGASHPFAPRLVEQRLASSVRGALVQARRDGIADVQRLAIAGSRFRFETLEELLRDDGYAIVPATVADLESPSWSLAYGLATWSIARRGLTDR